MSFELRVKLTATYANEGQLKFVTYLDTKKLQRHPTVLNTLRKCYTDMILICLVISETDCNF